MAAAQLRRIIDGGGDRHGDRHAAARRPAARLARAGARGQRERHGRSCSRPAGPIRCASWCSSPRRTTTDRPPRIRRSSARRCQAPGAGRTAIEREVVAAEQAVAEFAATRPGVTVTVLRVADVARRGAGRLASRLARACRSCPRSSASILACSSSTRTTCGRAAPRPGAHAPRPVQRRGRRRAARCRRSPRCWASRCCRCCRRGGSGSRPAQLRRLGLRVPVELVRQLRYGRGLDNRRLKVAGYEYRYTTREAVLKLRAHQRLRPLLRQRGEARTATSARSRSSCAGARASRPARARAAGRRPADDRRDGGGYDDLAEGELIEIISSLDVEALERLRDYEAAHRARATVVLALEHNLARLTQGSATGQEPEG